MSITANENTLNYVETLVEPSQLAEIIEDTLDWCHVWNDNKIIFIRVKVYF